ncbi:hypothetical protein PAMA_017906 [Pampus argenteus]
MALQPSSQSDSLAHTGDHRPADPDFFLRLLFWKLLDRSETSLIELHRLNEQMIPDSFMVCCDCTRCKMTTGKISDLCERGLSYWPRLKSTGARYDAARLVRGSNKMLSDLAPLEMSAPEPADARLSGVGSAQTPLRLAQLLPVRSREDDTYTRQDKTSSRDEPGPYDAFSPHSPIFLPHVLRLHLFSEKCICYCPAAAVAETDLCCPSARCAVRTTKSMREDDVGQSRNRSMLKCPAIALDPLESPQGPSGSALTPV